MTKVEEADALMKSWEDKVIPAFHVWSKKEEDDSERLSLKKPVDRSAYEFEKCWACAHQQELRRSKSPINWNM